MNEAGNSDGPREEIPRLMGNGQINMDVGEVEIPPLVENHVDEHTPQVLQTVSSASIASGFVGNPLQTGPGEPDCGDTGIVSSELQGVVQNTQLVNQIDSDADMNNVLDSKVEFERMLPSEHLDNGSRFLESDVKAVHLENAPAKLEDTQLDNASKLIETDANSVHSESPSLFEDKRQDNGSNADNSNVIDPKIEFELTVRSDQLDNASRFVETDSKAVDSEKTPTKLEDTQIDTVSKLIETDAKAVNSESTPAQFQGKELGNDRNAEDNNVLDPKIGFELTVRSEQLDNASRFVETDVKEGHSEDAPAEMEDTQLDNVSKLPETGVKAVHLESTPQFEDKQQDNDSKATETDVVVHPENTHASLEETQLYVDNKVLKRDAEVAQSKDIPTNETPFKQENEGGEGTAQLEGSHPSLNLDRYDSGTEDEQAAFMKELENFHKERNLEFKPPRFYGEGLNCLKLWRAVASLGGYDRVTSSKLWRQVGESFNPPKTCTTVSWSFRCFYEKALLEYEKYKLSTGELQVPIPELTVVENQVVVNQVSGSGRARRDAATRAMQGWHSLLLLNSDEVGEPIIKEKNSALIKREEHLKSISSLKRKKVTGLEHEDKDRLSKVAKSQADAMVADVGAPANWVKINVQRNKDCFEVYALVPGLLREEVHVQSDPAGRVVISGKPEQPDNPWGVTPFKKVITLPLRIDPHRTSAVVTLHGQLFIRAPFEQSDL